MITLESLILRDIGIISRSIQSISDIEFKQLNLQKGQFIYLTRICETPGISQVQLSSILKVDKASTAKAVQKLEQAGLIQRDRDQSDQRVWRLAPTQKGLEVYPVVIAQENHFIEQCLAGFSEAEKALAVQLLKKMALNIESDWNRRHSPKAKGYPLEIAAYQINDQAEVASHIITIQRDEFDIPITIRDQPDLLAIESHYQVNRGNFFVARHQGRLVGTIGLIDIGNRQGALRKMFVKPEYRGRPYIAGYLLLQQLLAWAKDQGMTEIYLGTTPFFKAAHRFYEKNGFQEIGVNELPESFPVMKVDTRFYKLVTGTAAAPQSVGFSPATYSSAV